MSNLKFGTVVEHLDYFYWTRSLTTPLPTAVFGSKFRMHIQKYLLVSHLQSRLMVKNANCAPINLVFTESFYV